MSNKNQNIDLPTLKRWLTVFIAVLSALAGALGEHATDFVGKIF